jgi:hypothetical protein
VCHEPQQRIHRTTLLSRAAVSAAADIHPKLALNAEAESFTAKKNCWKSSDATICVRADRHAAFKNCCLRSGRFDGCLRDYFFPRVSLGKAVCHPERSFCSPESKDRYP